jgi:hypothetical protein
MGELASNLLKFGNQITGRASDFTVYSLMGDMLKSKGAMLSAICSTIETILNMLDAMSNFSGAYVLPISGHGNKQWFQDQLINSSGGPFDADPVPTYTGGALFMAYGPTTTEIELLFDLFGMEAQF